MTPRPRGRSRRIAVALTALVVVATAALFAASPGNSSSHQALKGAPVKVMTIASVNYNGPSFKNIHEVAKTYAKYINDHGGIGPDHRPLQVNTCDDRGDPNQLAVCGRTAVAEKDVAVIGSFTLNADTVVPILAKAGIPWFGICCPTVASEFSSKDSYPMGSGIGVIAGQAYLAGKLPNCTKVGLLVLDIPAKPFIIQLVQNSLKHSGKTLVKTVTIPAAVGGDYSPAVADITTGTDCVVSGLGEANWLAFMPALKAGGTKGVLFMGAQGNLDQKVFSSVPGIGEGFISCGVYPDESLPQWATYRAALKQYKADPAQDYNSLGGLGTWAGYVGFTKVAASVKNLTAASFTAALNKTSHLTTGKLTPTINFTKEWTGLPGFNRLFNRYVTFDVVKNGKLVPYQNGAFYDLTGALEGK